MNQRTHYQFFANGHFNYSIKTGKLVDIDRDTMTNWEKTKFKTTSYDYKIIRQDAEDINNVQKEYWGIAKNGTSIRVKDVGGYQDQSAESKWNTIYSANTLASQNIIKQSINRNIFIQAHGGSNQYYHAYLERIAISYTNANNVHKNWITNIEDKVDISTSDGKASVDITFSKINWNAGVTSLTIPKGTQIGTASKILFKTNADLTLTNTSGLLSVKAWAVNFGTSGNVASLTINSDFSNGSFLTNNNVGFYNLQAAKGGIDGPLNDISLNDLPNLSYSINEIEYPTTNLVYLSSCSVGRFGVAITSFKKVQVAVGSDTITGSTAMEDFYKMFIDICAANPNKPIVTNPNDPNSKGLLSIAIEKWKTCLKTNNNYLHYGFNKIGSPDFDPEFNKYWNINNLYATPKTSKACFVPY